MRGWVPSVGQTVRSKSTGKIGKIYAVTPCCACCRDSWPSVYVTYPDGKHARGYYHSYEPVGEEILRDPTAAAALRRVDGRIKSEMGKLSLLSDDAHRNVVVNTCNVIRKWILDEIQKAESTVLPPEAQEQAQLKPTAEE